MLPLVEYPNFCTTIYLLYMGYLEQMGEWFWNFENKLPAPAFPVPRKHDYGVRWKWGWGIFEILQAVHWSLDGFLWTCLERVRKLGNIIHNIHSSDAHIEIKKWSYFFVCTIRIIHRFDFVSYHIRLELGSVGRTGCTKPPHFSAQVSWSVFLRSGTTDPQSPVAEPTTGLATTCVCWDVPWSHQPQLRGKVSKLG